MERWGVSLAYTHPFGITKPNLDFSATSTSKNVIDFTAATNLKGIEVNSVLLGAYYKFA